MSNIGLVEVARSFSVKLGADYGSRGFFCSAKTECRIEDFNAVADQLFEMCRVKVLDEVELWKASHQASPLDDGFADPPKKSEPGMPRRASEVERERQSVTAADVGTIPPPKPTPVQTTVTSQPSVRITQPPAHLLQLKEMANTIGGHKTEEILRVHGIAAKDAKTITLEQFTKMKPDLEKAVEAVKKGTNGAH
jgi:hypothetical protein